MMNIGQFETEIVESHIDELTDRYPRLETISKDLVEAGLLLVSVVQDDGKLLICGNGGSASDADHIVGELMKSFKKERPLDDDLINSLVAVDEELGGKLSVSLQGGIPAVALTQHGALSTAFSNDVDPYMVFAQQTSVLGRSGDLFMGLTTSGNSRNVILGAVTAKAKGLKVLGLTGRGGGTLKTYCDVCLCVPETETYKVQELHLPIYHTLCLILEEVFW